MKDWIRNTFRLKVLPPAARYVESLFGNVPHDGVFTACPRCRYEYVRLMDECTMCGYGKTGVDDAVPENLRLTK
jgi:hypothetical protein